MSDWTNFDQANAALNDPNLPPAELAAIAAAQAGLRPRVAAHPSVYPDLLAWLADQGVTPPPPQAAAPSWQQQQQQQPQQPAYPGQQEAWGQQAAPPPGAWAQPAPATPQPAGQPAAPVGPGTWGEPPKPKRKRWVVPVAVAAAAIVLGAGAAGIVALTRDDQDAGADRQTQAPKEPKESQAKTPGGQDSESPAGDESETPGPDESESAQGDPGSRRSIQLVEDGDEVWYDPGETPYTGVALLDSVDFAELGFILSEDGKSLHDLTIRLAGGELTRDLSITSMTRSTTQEFDIVDGKVTCDVGSDSENVILELTFGLTTATGSLTFDFESSSGQSKDLGSGSVAVSPADVD
jgi:hypothetical protein